MEKRTTRKLAALLATVVCLHAGNADAKHRKGLTAEREGRGARHALVIGNQEYARGALENPRHDAEAMAKKLRSLGFEVELRTDQSLKQLDRAVDDYLSKVRSGDISFVYYSGHGMQIEDANYLIPVDFASADESDVKYDAYPLDKLMDKLGDRNLALSVVVLDACRDNMFRRTRGGPRGLAGVNAAEGTLIAFATSPGKTASDGQPGTHGVYTAALLRALDVANVDVDEMFKEVREEVARRTNREQVPWSSSSVIGAFCLKGSGCGSGGAVADNEAPDTGDVAPGEAAPAGAPAPAPAPAPSCPSGSAWSASLGKCQCEPGTAWDQSAGQCSAPSAEAPEASSDSGTKIGPKSGLEFVSLPGGTFHYGCEPQDTQCFDNEKPGREVTVSPFWLGKTDVTVAAYAKCVSAGTCTAPNTGGVCNWGVSGKENHPVNCVDWNQAVAFCAWIGGRLPSAEEWEWAAKGGESRIYPWGNEAPDENRALFGKPYPGDGTALADSYGSGATKQGLLNMAGNVLQWTASNYDANTKEVRGGSWLNYPLYLRASSRNRNAPGDWGGGIGFRCGL